MGEESAHFPDVDPSIYQVSNSAELPRIDQKHELERHVDHHTNGDLIVSAPLPLSCQGPLVQAQD